jgi:hypothetical protein
MRPTGYFLQALMIVVVASSLPLFYVSAGRHPWLMALTAGGAISLILVLASLCAKWGFRYSIASCKAGLSDDPNQ